MQLYQKETLTQVGFFVVNAKFLRTSFLKNICEKADSENLSGAAILIFRREVAVRWRPTK